MDSIKCMCSFFLKRFRKQFLYKKQYTYSNLKLQYYKTLLFTLPDHPGIYTLTQGTQVVYTGYLGIHPIFSTSVYTTVYYLPLSSSITFHLLVNTLPSYPPPPNYPTFLTTPFHQCRDAINVGWWQSRFTYLLTSFLNNRICSHIAVSCLEYLSLEEIQPVA